MAHKHSPASQSRLLLQLQSVGECELPQEKRGKGRTAILPPPGPFIPVGMTGTAVHHHLPHPGADVPLNQLSFHANPSPCGIHALAQVKNGKPYTVDDYTLLAEPIARANSFVGTEEYLAPEVINAAGHSAPVD
eukprot:scaffold130016_cov21-Tisochrysis_lutea.AAC.3